MAALGFGLILVLLLLFASNGLSESWRTPTIVGAAVPPDLPPREVRILALNIAKASFHEGGVRFAEPKTVRERLDRMADAMRAAAPDLIALSEVVFEAGPCPVDQAAHLASALGFSTYALGENYSFGLPFYRIRTGNVLLSRFPLRGLLVQQLDGQRPFHSPTNNRRTLWCEVLIGDRWVTCASLRNDSFSLRRNHRHAQEILSRVPDEGAILAGDFNAELHDDSLEVFRSADRFTGTFHGEPTFPAPAPKRCIDFVLAPKSWTLVDQKTIHTGVSDHLAVLAVFRLP